VGVNSRYLNVQSGRVSILDVGVLILSGRGVNSGCRGVLGGGGNARRCDPD
jgi:hypothetical protein